MVDGLLITYLALCIVGIILNGIGLSVLVPLKTSGTDTQRIIIINLCVFDFCLSVVLTINQLLSIFTIVPLPYRIIVNAGKVVVNVGCYYSKFWLVFDRYLHIKLNIRYALYWSKKKTIRTTMLLWGFTVLSGSLIGVFIYNFKVFVYALFDLIILIFSIFVYTHALKLLIRKNSMVRSNQPQRSMWRGLLIPGIILTTFTVLVVVPDSILVVNTFLNIDSGPLIIFLNLGNSISLWSDAIIYIFISPQARLAFKNKFGMLKAIFAFKKNWILS